MKPTFWMSGACWLMVVVLTNVSLTFSQNRSTDLSEPNLPRIQKSELLNGLKVVLVKRSELPTTINLLIKAGSASDAEEMSGLADLTARSLFSANQKKTAGQWNDELESLGIQFKIRIAPDATVFQAELPSASVDAYLTLLSKMLISPVLEQKSLEGIKQEVRNSAMAVGELDLGKRYFQAIVFERHPYGKPPGGNPDSVEKAHLEDILGFCRAQYVPNNAALVIVGEASTENSADMVREKFGGWVKGEYAEPRYSAPSVKERLSVELLDREVDDVSIVVGTVLPDRLTRDFYQLILMNAILGDLGQSSRLAGAFSARNISHKYLKSEMALLKFAGHLQVLAQVPESATLPALQTVLSVLDSLKTTPVTPSELQEAKRHLLEAHESVLASSPRLADEVTDAELYNLASDHLVSFPRKLEKVAAEEIAEIAKTYLSTTRASAVVLGRANNLKSQLKELAPIEVPPVTSKTAP